VRADVECGFTNGEGGMTIRGLSGRMRVAECIDSVEAEEQVDRVEAEVDPEVVVIVESVEVCLLSKGC